MIAVNKHDILQKMYDFGDRFILECMIKENNAFWKDILFVGLMNSMFSLSNIATKSFLFPTTAQLQYKKSQQAIRERIKGNARLVCEYFNFFNFGILSKYTQSQLYGFCFTLVL